MAARRRKPEPTNTNAVTPSQQDEADIIAEVGAETDPDTGGLTIPEDRVREIGALDAESIRENRRMDEVVGKKRAGLKNVHFNIDDVLVLYDQITRFWPASGIDISVKRLTGTALQQTITTHPKNGAELYEALKQFHGPNPEASYALNFVDSASKHYLGKGDITMPDARPPAQQGQPMNPYHPYPPPPGYPPPGYPQPQQPQQAAPQPQPQPMMPPPMPTTPPTSPAEMMALLQQGLEWIQRMQAQAAPAAPQQPPTPSPAAVSAPAAVPQGPPGWTFIPNFGWVQNERLFQAIGGPAPAVQPSPPPSVADPMGAPPITPPPGMMWVPGFGFMSIDALMQAQAMAANGGRPVGPAYRPGGPGGYGPRPYGPTADPGAAPRAPAYAPPVQRPRTATEELRDSLSLLRTVSAMADELRGPQAPAAPEPPAPAATEDESPVRVIDAGPAKLVVNRGDGSLRGVETLFANAGDILKWLGEQREAIQKAHREQAEREARQQQKPQLPPGYVEVGPGYQPPAGYVAVPVDQIPQQPQQPLPEPPADIPPPITPVTTSRRTWDMPPSVGEEG